MTRWSQIEGSAQPLGAVWLREERSYNFALYSRHATGVTLLLYITHDLVNPVRRISLNYLIHKSGRIWHCRLAADEVADARYYAYSVEGPTDPHGERHFFDPDKVLLDPYATSLFFPPKFRRRASIGRGSNAGRAPLCALPDGTSSFDWSDESRPTHTSDTIIYELHVRGFTRRRNSGVAADKRGTYAGLIDKIPYLTGVGRHRGRIDASVSVRPGRGQLLGLYAFELFLAAPRLCRGPERCGSCRRIQDDGEGSPSGRDRSDSRRGLQPHYRGWRRRTDL